MPIAHVTNLYRYPVKSVGGGEVDRIEISNSGVVGDRNWAIIDERESEIRTARRWPRLLHLVARYLVPPVADAYDDTVSPVEISGLDGSSCASNSPEIDAWLSRQLERPAHLSPRQPAHRVDHYCLNKGYRPPEEIMEAMDWQEGEIIPDWSNSDNENIVAMQKYVTVPGTYVDASPVHLLSQNSLDDLAQTSGLDASHARFRPNVVINVPGGKGTPELDWVGRRLALGTTILRVRAPTIRCVIPGRAQPFIGLTEQSRMTGVLVRQYQRMLGVYLLVEQPGTVSVGDAVEVIEGES